MSGRSGEGGRGSSDSDPGLPQPPEALLVLGELGARLHFSAVLSLTGSLLVWCESQCPAHNEVHLHRHRIEDFLCDFLRFEG